MTKHSPWNINDPDSMADEIGRLESMNTKLVEALELDHSMRYGPKHNCEDETYDTCQLILATRDQK